MGGTSGISLTPPPRHVVLNMTKAAQIQHGLRHGDYARYRQYCARRLTRLRKTLGFTHGKGRFTQKRLNVQQVTQQKCVSLSLQHQSNSYKSLNNRLWGVHHHSILYSYVT